MKPLSMLLVLFLFFTSCNGLRILFILPCYGGHFGTMTPLIVTMSDTHDVTVVATSPSCRDKIVPIRQQASFKFIEKDLTFHELHFEGYFDMLMTLLEESPSFLEKLYRGIKEFLIANKEKYDVMIVDGSQAGTLIAAEVANIPTAVIMSGIPGPIENVLDKMNTTLFEAFAPIALEMLGYKELFDKLRNENSLPHFVSLGNFYRFEYQSRFPAMIMMSPMFYPKPHPSVPAIFIGASRIGTPHNSVPNSMTDWLYQSDANVIYIALGTHVVLDEETVQQFIYKIRDQNNYRLIWAMGKSMLATAQELGLTTDKKTFLGGHLPQYSLLGLDKVKVFVTHAGLGSTIDLVKRRKPSVCVPQLFDQFYNCKKLSSLSIAEEVLSSFSFDTIDDAIQKVLGNYDVYKQNADKFAKELESYYEKQHLENFLNEVAAKKEIQFIKELEFDFASERFYRAWLLLKLSIFIGVIGPLVGLILLFRVCCCKKKKTVAVKPKTS